MLLVERTSVHQVLTHAMDELSSLLSAHGLDSARDVLIELGAEEVSDLKLVDSDMLRQTNLKPIMQKKLLAFCNRAFQGTPAIPPTCSATEFHPARTPTVFNYHDSTKAVGSNGTMQSTKGDQIALHNAGGGKRSSGELHESVARSEEIEEEMNIDTMSLIPDVDIDIRPVQDRQTGGIGCPSKKPRIADKSTTSSVTSKAYMSSRVGFSTEEEERCAEIISAIVKMLPDAKFTAYERKRRKREYSYARLSEIILLRAFDANGRWMLHRKCLSEALLAQNLKVSNSWLSDKHSEAIKLSGLRTDYMTKSQIASCPERRMYKLISNIILPPECTLSGRLFYRSQSMDYKFKIARPDKTMHKLIGNESNRARLLERDRFRAFVKANRQPNGRTMHRDNRSHGSSYYLDSTIARVKPKDPSDDNSSLVFKFNKALESEWNTHISYEINKPFKPVSATAVDAWMKQDFGSMVVANGVRVSSAEHTTVFPHKTDACARCEVLKTSIRSLQQRKKRHEQQSDQGSLTRQDVLRDVRNEIDDVSHDLNVHKAEAEAATINHRRCVDSAFNKFKHTDDLFNEMRRICRSDECDVRKREEIVQSFCHEASRTFLDLSSDYQQDKSIPAWNQSPQPGPTYYCSGTTHYVHIFCVESLGRGSGPTRFSRNVVFTRSEAVAGAKVSDDTLSTLGDVLLGYRHPYCTQPPLFRSGYDKDGRLLDGHE